MKPKPKSKKTSAPKTSRKDTRTKATRKGGSGRKGRTTEYVTPTIDTPSTPEPEAATSQSAPVERDADGREPIPGPTLVRALKYVHAVVPKEGGDVFYTHDKEGRPVVSGHDDTASFTFYLPEKAVWECDIAVPRNESVRFVKLLDGLPVASMVRVDAEGHATIRHDPAQPEVVVNLGTRVIVDRWQPPSKADRVQSLVPLRMDAGKARKARAVPEAIARSWQSADGIEWVDLCSTIAGDTLARAVIAEDGRDLYHDDGRQTEIPGSRTAGTNTDRMAAAKAAAQDLRNMMSAHGGSISVVTNGEERVVYQAPGATIAVLPPEPSANAGHKDGDDGPPPDPPAATP